MSNRSRRLSRGDRHRNARLARLRAVVTRESAVLAFDLAADKQVCALTDQDSQVLGCSATGSKPTPSSRCCWYQGTAGSALCRVGLAVARPGRSGPG